MLKWIIFFYSIYTINSTCLSTLSSQDGTCSPSSYSVASCDFIMTNADAICSSLLTGWEIANGPSCSIKGASYGCEFQDFKDATTQFLCCSLISSSNETPSSSARISQSPPRSVSISSSVRQSATVTFTGLISSTSSYSTNVSATPFLSRSNTQTPSLSPSPLSSRSKSQTPSLSPSPLSSRLNTESPPISLSPLSSRSNTQTARISVSPLVSVSRSSSEKPTQTLNLHQNIIICNTNTLTLPIIGSSSVVLTNPAGSEYNSNLNCNLQINAPLDSYLLIQILSFSTEAGYDFFRVYDSSNSQLFGNSGTLSPFSLTSSSSSRITFTTDGNVVSSGVVCIVTAIKSSDSPSPSTSNSYSVTSRPTRSYPSLSPSTTSSNSRSFSISSSPSLSKVSFSPPGTNSITRSSHPTPTLIYEQSINMCNINRLTLPIIGSSAKIVTNTVGTNYVNFLNCALLIDAPIDSYIFINISSFSTQIGYDFFTVYSNGTNLLWRGSGQLAPFILKAFSPSTLLFSSDGAHVFRGVNIIATSLEITTSTPTTSSSFSPSFTLSPSISASPSSTHSLSYSAGVSKLASDTHAPSRTSTTSFTSKNTFSSSSQFTFTPTPSRLSRSPSPSITSSLTGSLRVSNTTTQTYSETLSLLHSFTERKTRTSSAEFSVSKSQSTTHTPSSYETFIQSESVSVSSSPSDSAYPTTLQTYSNTVSPSATVKIRIPILPNLTGISEGALQGLFEDMLHYNPVDLSNTLNTLALAGLQGGKTEFSVNTSMFSIQIKKLDVSSNAKLAVGQTAINLPSFGALGKEDISAASVIRWTSNPYSDLSPVSVDTSVLAINVLSSNSSQVSIKNLSTPITMSWPLPSSAEAKTYLVNCDTKQTYLSSKLNIEPVLPLLTFNNGTYILSCNSNDTLTLHCERGTWKSGTCVQPNITTECVYWNTSSNTWASDGCFSYLINTTIHCECSHLTDFSVRIKSIANDNKNIFNNAKNVYSAEGLEKYSQWYGIFGGIGLFTLILMYIGHSCDRPITRNYIHSLLSNELILSTLEKVPFTPLYRYDSKTMYKYIDQTPKKEEPPGETTLGLYTRIVLENSRLQAFFRYDPRLGRMFRILTIFVLQFHSLFVTSFLYGFVHSNPTPMNAYDIIFLSFLTSLFNIPCVIIIMNSLNIIGKGEFINKYPVLYEEYKRRIEFEKYALSYQKCIKNDIHSKDEVTELEFLDDSESIVEVALMYFCCRIHGKEKEATKMKRMNKNDILNKLIEILDTPYARFDKYSLWWEFVPCHTIYGGIFLTCAFGWLGWCLNYLLLFASYHSKHIGEGLIVTYLTSELTTVFVYQPLTIAATALLYLFLHKYGHLFPWPLSIITDLSHKKRVPSVFFYSNPWNAQTHSSLTSEFAYVIFVKAAAAACKIPETSYAPIKSILDKVNNKDVKESEENKKVKELYTQLGQFKFKKNMLRQFV